MIVVWQTVIISTIILLILNVTEVISISYWMVFSPIWGLTGINLASALLVKIIQFFYDAYKATKDDPAVSRVNEYLKYRR